MDGVHRAARMIESLGSLVREGFTVHLVSRMPWQTRRSEAGVSVVANSRPDKSGQVRTKLLMGSRSAVNKQVSDGRLGPSA
jgi:hypothetical protein